jgi:uncharacterized membrane protein
VVRLEVYFRQVDTLFPVTIEYIVRDAATKWDDTAELYWKFIGDEWDHGVGSVGIHITLPSGVEQDEVRAWGHGPLNGVVTREPDGSVTMTVDDLPAYRFVEARILFPREALPDAPATTGARVDDVLAEEQQWADEANAERRRASLRRAAGLLIGIGVPLAALVVFVWAYRRYGREHRPSFTGEYYRELPEPALPPALVGSLWRMGAVKDEDAVATLMDLIDRGMVELERTTTQQRGLFGVRDEETYLLRLHAERRIEVSGFEARLLEVLFGVLAEGDTLDVDEMKGLAK